MGCSSSLAAMAGEPAHHKKDDACRCTMAKQFSDRNLGLASSKPDAVRRTTSSPVETTVVPADAEAWRRYCLAEHRAREVRPSAAVEETTAVAPTLLASIDSAVSRGVSSLSVEPAATALADMSALGKGVADDLVAKFESTWWEQSPAALAVVDHHEATSAECKAPHVDSLGAEATSAECKAPHVDSLGAEASFAVFTPRTARLTSDIVAKLNVATPRVQVPQAQVPQPCSLEHQKLLGVDEEDSTVATTAGDSNSGVCVELKHIERLSRNRSVSVESSGDWLACCTKR